MSKKMEIKSSITLYLRQHFLAFNEDVYEGTDRITMVFRNCEHCPGRVTEGSIYFNSDHMECRVYYSAASAKWWANSSHQSEFFQLMNYINATVWLCGADGVGGALYKSKNLYTPRLYMTEDGYHDITATTIVPYDFFEVAPLETEDFLTASLPELMDALSPAIFLLLLGEIDLSQAKRIVDRDVLGEE